MYQEIFATENTENTEIMKSKSSFWYTFANLQTLVLFLSALCVFGGKIQAQDFKTERDGIEYAEVTREISGQQVKMNLLRLDLTKVRLDIVHAMDATIGTEKTSSIATRHGAFAAINAGFFRLDNSIFAGDPAGLLMINNSLLSESLNGRAALMIANAADQTDVQITRSNVNNNITVKGKDYDVGTNRERGEDDVVIYTPTFHRTTLTDNSGIEFVVRRDRVIQVRDLAGNTEIPCDGYVLSVSGNKRSMLSAVLKSGAKIRLSLHHSSPTETIPDRIFGQSEDIVGGVPQLIKNGKVDVTWQEEKSSKSFVETRHPRTAVAKLKDGKFLMITVDGRSESSGGIGLYDLANYLLELGATDAMNLDGGGSSTMFLDGKVVNHPSDKEGERKVSDAILVFPRHQ